jgi:hypothetical protein
VHPTTDFSLAPVWGICNTHLCFALAFVGPSSTPLCSFFDDAAGADAAKKLAASDAGDPRPDAAADSGPSAAPRGEPAGSAGASSSSSSSSGGVPPEAAGARYALAALAALLKYVEHMQHVSFAAKSVRLRWMQPAGRMVGGGARLAVGCVVLG